MNIKVILFTACVFIAMFPGSESTSLVLKAKALLAAKAVKLALIKKALISKHHYSPAPAPEIPHPHIALHEPHHEVVAGNLHEKIGSVWQSASSAATNKAIKIKAGISALNPIPYLQRLTTKTITHRPSVVVPVLQLHPNTAFKHYNVIEYYPVKPIEIVHAAPVHHEPQPVQPYPPAPAVHHY